MLSFRNNQMDLYFLDNTVLADKAQHIQTILENSSLTASQKWQVLTKEILNPNITFTLHLKLYQLCYQNESFKPMWFPDEKVSQNYYLAQWMKRLNIDTVADFHRYSIEQAKAFWQQAIDDLAIEFTQPANCVFDYSLFPYTPTWLPNARFNIANSCVNVDNTILNKPAILYHKHIKEKITIETLSYKELDTLSTRIAQSLITHYKIKPQSKIAIVMPMNIEAVAMYIAIIKLGSTVVSIADSFSINEICTRLKISNCQLVFTQDFIERNDKALALYQKITETEVASIICLKTHSSYTRLHLRPQDIDFESLLNLPIALKSDFNSYMQSAQTPINVLFSSGTTGTPKAIIWEQSTALKAATDAKLYMNTNTSDIWAWPTNLGWMMGPWLIFATFINRATLALFDGVPTSLDFIRFVEKAKVTKLGVIPSIVNAWRNQNLLEKINWQHIQLFATTGEASNPEDMLYLSMKAGYKPIIEYCGGTEIGGAYISSTLLQPNVPSCFSTPCFGIELKLLNTQQEILNDEGLIQGEAALSSCALGLSNRLLNANNNAIYYEKMPYYHNVPLRRHGDLLLRLENGYYRSLGRADNTMNLGGIKTSSAEIEQVLLQLDNVYELAAIAVSDENEGISKLVIYVVTKQDCAAQLNLKIKCRAYSRRDLILCLKSVTLC